MITDSAPATVVTTPQRGPSGIVQALSAVRPGGARDTVAALTSATRQFPTVPAGQRVVILYTTAPRAGSESAAALGALFRATGTILVVVGTVQPDSYWAVAAAATGGFFAPAGNPVVIPALDQVQTTLRGRYLVQFPTPSTLPAQVSVRVDTGDLILTGDATLTEAAVGAAERSPGRTIRKAVVGDVIIVGLLGVVGATLLVLVLRRRRGPRTSRPPVSPEVRGQAAVPGPAPVARGRAAIPKRDPGIPRSQDG